MAHNRCFSFRLLCRAAFCFLCLSLALFYRGIGLGYITREIKSESRKLKQGPNRESSREQDAWIPDLRENFEPIDDKKTSRRKGKFC